jgi:hypothetical protein
MDEAVSRIADGLLGAAHRRAAVHHLRPLGLTRIALHESASLLPEELFIQGRSDLTLPSRAVARRRIQVGLASRITTVRGLTA